MLRLPALLWPILLMWTSFAHAQNRPEPIRLCVSTLQNSSRSLIDTTWQRNQLIKAFERANKGKNVAKGKAARIETVLLESNTETDPFSVFLGLPQGRRIVHSFCTRTEVFCVARRNELAESGFSET